MAPASNRHIAVSVCPLAAAISRGTPPDYTTVETRIDIHIHCSMTLTLIRTEYTAHVVA